jgi:hypothetical protein
MLNFVTYTKGVTCDFTWLKSWNILAKTQKNTGAQIRLIPISFLKPYTSNTNQQNSPPLNLIKFFRCIYFGIPYATIPLFTVQINLKSFLKFFHPPSRSILLGVILSPGFSMQFGQHRLSLRKSYDVRSRASSPTIKSAVSSIKISEW